MFSNFEFLILFFFSSWRLKTHRLCRCFADDVGDGVVVVDDDVGDGADGVGEGWPIAGHRD